MSKGSNQRPKAIDDETFDSNWERVFGGKLDEGRQEAASLAKEMNTLSDGQEV